jgi:hypothetical protein
MVAGQVHCLGLCWVHLDACSQLDHRRPGWSHMSDIAWHSAGTPGISFMGTANSVCVCVGWVMAGQWVQSLSFLHSLIDSVSLTFRNDLSPLCGLEVSSLITTHQ